MNKDDDDLELDKAIMSYTLKHGPTALMESVAMWLCSLARAYEKQEIVIDTRDGRLIVRTAPAEDN